MDTKKNNPEGREITIKYKFSDDYNPVYSNGAYGGVTPNGEIVVNFYFERHALPNQEIITDKERKFNPENLKQSMVRYVDNGVILDVRTAHAIIAWLQVKVALAEKIVTGKQGEAVEKGDKT